MSAAGKPTTITALLTNVVIAIAKCVAWALSGSFALLAEGVHSLALAGKQVLQLLGGRGASSGGSTDASPAVDEFAHARSRSIYAFAGATVLFAIGGAFSVYAGIVKLQNPEPTTMWWLPVGVLVLVIVVKYFSMTTAMKKSSPVAGAGSRSSLRQPQSPNAPAVRLDEPAGLAGLVIALVGVVLTVVTGNGVFDGIATLLIGVMLIGVAIVTGTDVQRLLIGAPASAAEAALVEAALLNSKDIERIIDVSVHALGPDARIVGAKVSLAASTTMAEVSVIMNLAERRVREALPSAQSVYIEPDVWLDPTLPTPTTSSIVMLSSD